VFYKNLDTGFIYTFNENRTFFAASLSKANHALYTFILAERGYIDMYQAHTYSAADAWGGTGTLRFMPTGLEFTTRELLGLSIRESDNAAFRMLLRLTQNAEFSYRDFVEEIGAEVRNIRDTFSQNTNARDKGRFMYEIFRYIEGDGAFAHYLRYDLLNTAQVSHPHFTRWYGSNGMGDTGIGTDVNIQMLRSDYPLARKYGWAGGAFHDAGIIYAPSPYILVVLSNMERGAHDIFEDISWFVQGFNNRTFVAPTILTAPPKGPGGYAADSVRVAGRPGGFRLAIPVFAEQPQKVSAVQRKMILKNNLR
jgi:beta-lactamase class A